MSTFLRFLLVGGVSTICHYLVLGSLVEFARVNVIVASTIGFFVGAVVNYLLNYSFTFKSDLAHTSAFPKFALTAMSGLLLNAAVMWVVWSLFGIYYVVAQIVATATAFAWNFVVNSIWSFKVKR